MSTGARLWNAAIALEVRPSALIAEADTTTVCLSKGLGAPVGSVLVGPADFIYQVRFVFCAKLIAPSRAELLDFGKTRGI